ncbi:MAG: hypothetical protein AB7F19_00645 [Candidatus Babeliales bacterium]
MKNYASIFTALSLLILTPYLTACPQEQSTSQEHTERYKSMFAEALRESDIWIHLTQSEMEGTSKNYVIPEHDKASAFTIKETQLYKTLIKDVALLEMLIFQCTQGTISPANKAQCDVKDLYHELVQKKMALLYLNEGQRAHEETLKQLHRYLFN